MTKMQLVTKEWDEANLSEVNRLISDNKIGIYKNAQDAEAIGKQHSINRTRKGSIHNIYDGSWNGDYGTWDNDKDGDGTNDSPVSWGGYSYFMGGINLLHGNSSLFNGHMNAAIADGSARSVSKAFLLSRERSFWSARMQ